MDGYTEEEKCAIGVLKRMLVLRNRKLISKLDPSVVCISKETISDWTKEELNEMSLGVYDRCVQDKAVSETELYGMLKWLYKEGIIVPGSYTASMWTTMIARYPRLKTIYYVIEARKRDSIGTLPAIYV
jgi:hypothetical protein